MTKENIDCQKENAYNNFNDKVKTKTSVGKSTNFCKNKLVIKYKIKVKLM